jgi:hypothetical protein
MTLVAAAYRARWVLPVTSPPIDDGIVLVDRAGRIQAIGSWGTVPCEDAELIDLGDSVILPGLVNLHAHPELTVLRGQLETASFSDWLARLTELKYSVLTPEALRISTWLGVAENIPGCEPVSLGTRQRRDAHGGAGPSPLPGWGLHDAGLERARRGGIDGRPFAVEKTDSQQPTFYSRQPSTARLPTPDSRRSTPDVFDERRRSRVER